LCYELVSIEQGVGGFGRRSNDRGFGGGDRDRDPDGGGADRGPPPVANSRFAAAAEADRSSYGGGGGGYKGSRDFGDRGPPPVANSRFAAAAEADRSYGGGGGRDARGGGGGGDYDRGGPPPAANSRFSALADDEDRPYQRRGGGGGGGAGYDNSDDRGPPPVPTNSRFARAAAMAEGEGGGERGGGMERDNRRRDYGDRRDDRGPPTLQNSRFADAVASDPDYMDKDERERRRQDRDEYRRGGPGGGGGYGGGRDGGCYQDRTALPTGPRGDDYVRDDFKELEQRAEAEKKRVADVLKPKAPPPTENILNFPTSRPAAPEHEANVLKVPDKATAKSKKDSDLEAPKKADKASLGKKEAAASAPSPKPAVNSEETMKEFISGGRLGEKLKEWTEQNRAALPPIETLMFEMLKEREKLNPDPECAWAQPENFGAALQALVEDDVVAQMRVLWGIQFYCDKLGFPKLNNESVVQSMFRAMYKYDLADSDAFAEWKDDESDEYSRGKLNAVIQTVEWFNWLEADDDDGEGEDEEEDE
jgi:eIF4-gamma/eIF5/eIF2-epsilon